jgi:hypothetical protein
MAFVRDALTWVDTGAVAYPALHAHIIELTMPGLVVKKLFPEFPLVAGKTATFVKQSGSRAAAISETAEGTEIMMDFTPYTTITTTPYKKALRERISRENIEDLYIPVIEDQLRRLARRMVYTIDKDCQSVIDAGAASANTFTATGTSMGATGAPFTISGGLGQYDITNAISLLQQVSLVPDHILLNPVNSRDVYKLPQFSIASWFGPTQEGPLIQTGSIGTIMGCEVDVSPVIPAGTAYILSTGLNVSAAYAPIGFFVIKRPLLSDLDPKKEFDSIDVVLSTRYSPVVTYGEAICKITNLATS